MAEPRHAARPAGDPAVRDAVAWAAHLGRSGDPAGAAAVYAELLAHLRAQYGGDHPDTLACQADLAVAMHAAGDCRAGRELLADAHARRSATQGVADRTGIRMLARLAILTRECGDFDGAHRHFRTAGDLARAHLGRGDRLTQSITRAAREGRTSDHVCRAEQSGEPSDGPTLPPGTHPLPGEDAGAARPATWRNGAATFGRRGRSAGR